MSTITRLKTNSAAAGAALTITYDEPTPPSAAFGHVLVFESHTNTASTTLLPQAAVIDVLEAAGWHHVTDPGFESVNGNARVRTDHFTHRGDGAINGVTIPATANVTRRGTLHTLDAINTDLFHHDVVASFSSSNTITSRSVDMPAAAVGGAVTILAVGISGSAGGTSPQGFVWNRGTAGFGGTSSSSGFSSRYEVVNPPAATTYSVTWTSPGSVSSLVGVTYGGVASVPTIVHTDLDEIAVRDFRTSASTSGGTLTHTISPTTGVTEPQDGLFFIAMTDQVQYFTVTSTDSTSGVAPVVTNLTIPALDTGGTGLEELIMVGGVLV